MASTDGLAEAAAWVMGQLRYERWLDRLVEVSGCAADEAEGDHGEVPRSA